MQLLIASLIASFGGTYILVSMLTAQPAIQIPLFIGCSLEAAATIAASQQLNLRITRMDTTVAYAPGTILEQHPAPATISKPNSPVYVVVAQLPEQDRTPNLIGMQRAAAEKKVQEASLKAISYGVMSNQPSNTVIAQTPAAQTAAQGTVTLYYAQEPTKGIVMPSLLGLRYQEVYAWAEDHQVELTLLGPPYKSAPVVAQYPVEGTIVHQRPITIEIATEEFSR